MIKQFVLKHVNDEELLELWTSKEAYNQNEESDLIESFDEEGIP